MSACTHMGNKILCISALPPETLCKIKYNADFSENKTKQNSGETESSAQ